MAKSHKKLKKGEESYLISVFKGVLKFGFSKKDLMKVIHYAILALNNHNLQHEKV